MEYEIDLSRLAMYKLPVIMTHNMSQRSAIEKAMRRDYPELMRLWKSGTLGSYASGDAYIAPHIYDRRINSLQATEDPGYWLDRDYDLVEFEDLLAITDLGEIESSGELEDLF